MNGSQSTEKPIKGEEKKWGGFLMVYWLPNSVTISINSF